MVYNILLWYMTLLSFLFDYSMHVLNSKDMVDIFFRTTALRVGTILLRSFWSTNHTQMKLFVFVFHCWLLTWTLSVIKRPILLCLPLFLSLFPSSSKGTFHSALTVLAGISLSKRSEINELLSSNQERNFRLNYKTERSTCHNILIISVCIFDLSRLNQLLQNKRIQINFLCE